MIPDECTNCGSREVGFDCHSKNAGSVMDGRLALREVRPEFYLGCGECGETLWVGDWDEFISGLREHDINIPFLR